MKNEEIQPRIMQMEKILAEKFPEWKNQKNQKSKLQKLSKWKKELMNELIIFNEKVFSNNTQEGNIIWNEVKENMTYQLTGIATNTIVWMIKNRFWINSKFAAASIGLKLQYKETKKGDLII